ITNHLKKDPQGKIEIFQKFWNFDYPWDDKTLVPPLLIYADLIATADDRNIETARIIYDQYIDGLIEKY
ncbi:MAG: type IV toxin-antitoxin system AbiEi family antitoxin, partial [Desulfobacterales bacterium]|nr:type IV toxin-antitoxin system AbiEi family antitoxin [Desulfobacterales bacterium]